HIPGKPRSDSERSRMRQDRDDGAGAVMALDEIRPSYRFEHRVYPEREGGLELPPFRRAWAASCVKPPPMHLLVVDLRLVVESGVTAPRVVPALDVLEDGHPPLGVGLEGATVDELALDAGEEAFTQGVVVGVADGSHRGPAAGLATRLPEGSPGGLRAVAGVLP